jgi:hypothetical protein
MTSSTIARIGTPRNIASFLPPRRVMPLPFRA